MRSQLSLTGLGILKLLECNVQVIALLNYWKTYTSVFNSGHGQVLNSLAGEI
jgi:hypothetical protein